MDRRTEKIIPIDCPQAREETETRYCPQKIKERERTPFECER